MAYPQLSAVTNGPLLETLTFDYASPSKNTGTIPISANHHTRPRVKHPWPLSHNVSTVTVHNTETVTYTIPGTVTVHVEQTITRTIWESEVTSTQSLNSLKSLVVGQSSISQEDIGGDSTTSFLNLSSSTTTISVHVTQTFTHTIWESELVTSSQSPTQEQTSFSLKSLVVGEDIGGDSTAFLSSSSSETATPASTSNEPDITSQNSTALPTLSASSSSETTPSSLHFSYSTSSSESSITGSSQVTTSTSAMSTFTTMQINANKVLGNDAGQTLVVTLFLPPP